MTLNFCSVDCCVLLDLHSHDYSGTTTLYSRRNDDFPAEVTCLYFNLLWASDSVFIRSALQLFTAQVISVRSLYIYKGIYSL